MICDHRLPFSTQRIRIPLLSALVLSLVFAFARGAMAAAPQAEASSASGDSDDAVVQAMSERWEARHEAEYGDPSIAKLRLDARQVEKDLITARRDFMAHMRANHGEVRAMEKAVRDAFAEATRLAGEEEVAVRERRIAEGGASVPGPGGEAREKLIRDLQAGVSAAREKAVAARKALESRCRELAVSDQKAAAMLEEIDLLEIEFSGSRARLNESVNKSPDVRALDAARVQQPRVGDQDSNRQSVHEDGVSEGL